MTGPTPTRSPLAGGFPIAVLTIAGPIVFAMIGWSPSLGFLVGLGTGVAVAIAIWLLGRK